MIKTIVIIKKETRAALKELGSKGETYDEVIAKLITFKKNGATSQTRSKLLHVSEGRDM